MDSNEETCATEVESSIVSPANITNDVFDVVMQELPPHKKRGRPRKIPQIEPEEEKASPKKRARKLNEDDEWTRRSPAVLVRTREAVVTRTRTGRTPRRSIYGDDFVSPFDTKTIKAELDKAAKRDSGSNSETFRRGRGRPRLKNAPILPPQKENSENMMPDNATNEVEIIVAETVEAPMEVIVAEIYVELPSDDMVQGTTQTILAVTDDVVQIEADMPIQLQPSYDVVADMPVQPQPSYDDVADMPVQPQPSYDVVADMSVQPQPSYNVADMPVQPQPYYDVVADMPVQPQPSYDVTVGPRKRGRGRPPKKKELEHEVDADLVDPDADLLEENSQEMGEGVFNHESVHECNVYNFRPDHCCDGEDRVVSKDWSRGLYWKSRWPAVIVS
jgi:hypothetical protein